MDSDDQENIPFIDDKDVASFEFQSSPKTNNRHKNPGEVPLLNMENEAGKCPESLERINVDSTVAPRRSLGADVIDVPFPLMTSDKENTIGSDDTLNRSHDLLRIVHDEEPGSRNNSFKYPMHSAAEKGKIKTLERLLVKGDPLQLDFKQKTVLHYACGHAYQKKSLRMVEAILKSPLAQDTPQDPSRKIRLINFQDKNGETGLHIAARTGHRIVVEKLLFAAADVNIKDNNKVEPLQLIYNKVPAAMIPVFNCAVECKVGDPNDQNLIVRFDFGAIVGYPEPEKDEPIFDLETKLLSYSLQQSEQKRSAILLHPIVQTFLHLKWKKIRYLLWISIFYHVIWLLFYTFFICDLYLVQCPYKLHKDNDHLSLHSNFSINSTANETQFFDYLDVNETIYLETGMLDESNDTAVPTTSISCEIGSHLLSSLNIELGFLLFVSASVMFKEMFEIYSSPQLKYYFNQLENVGQWLLIGVVILTSIPIITNFFVKDSIIVLHAWQYQAAALGIFLAWSLILSQIGKIPRFGIYIEILAKVIRSFTMFMITFASMLVAFMVSFQILMPEKVEFENVPWGFIKILVMMIGEINYDEMFFQEENLAEIPFPSSTKILFAAFVAIVTIILFNLLIGLTVSDIQGLQDVAQLSSLSSQVEQIYLMEKFIMNKKLQRWLIRINKNHWLRYFLVTQQTDDTDSYMGVDLHISKVPRDLQFQVREVAAPNIIPEPEESDFEESTYQDKIISGKHSTKVSSTYSFQNEDEDVVDATLVRNVRNKLDDQDLKEQIKSILKEILEELRESKSADATN